jgi:predicted O-methyltransferase YrrM
MPLPDTVHAIYGFLSPAEMELLYTLAANLSPNGRIMEIGSFQGKSTVCLGLGARVSGASVWAIDPHFDYQVNPETHYCMENHAGLLRNLTAHDLGATVRVVALSSRDVFCSWHKGIDLLWIDGSHERADIEWDIDHWAYKMNGRGKIAVHDASGHFPGVTQALDGFLADGVWSISQRVDALAVLERVLE